MKPQEAIKALRQAHAALVKAKGPHPTVDDEYRPEVLEAKARLWSAVQQAAGLGIDHVSILSELNKRIGK